MHVIQVKPINLTPKTAYLTGVIIGDGHISGSCKSQNDRSKDYRIVIDVTDEHYAKFIFRLIKSIVLTKSVLRRPKTRGNRKQSFYLQIRNKSLFYFLTAFMGIPAGAKSSVVSVPPQIKTSTLTIKKHFLAGLFDTDGGLRQGTIGFCTASPRLNQDVSDLLRELSITHSLDKWRNKQYNRVYYGIRIRKSEIDTFLNMLPLQNAEKLIRISHRFMRGCRSGQTGQIDSNSLLE